MTTDDLKVFSATFLGVFLAEMGDKTQLATMSMSAGAQGSRWVVFAGSAAALVATSAIAVLLGDTVARFISPSVLRKLAGAAFIVLGLLYVFERGAG